MKNEESDEDYVMMKNEESDEDDLIQTMFWKSAEERDEVYQTQTRRRHSTEARDEVDQTQTRPRNSTEARDEVDQTQTRSRNSTEARDEVDQTQTRPRNSAEARDEVDQTQIRRRNSAEARDEVDQTQTRPRNSVEARDEVDQTQTRPRKSRKSAETRDEVDQTQTRPRKSAKAREADAERARLYRRRQKAFQLKNALVPRQEQRFLPNATPSLPNALHEVLTSQGTKHESLVNHLRWVHQRSHAAVPSISLQRQLEEIFPKKLGKYEIAEQVFEVLDKLPVPDYDEVGTEDQLETIFEKGLIRPVVIPHHSHLGLAIQRRRDVAIPTPNDFFLNVLNDMTKTIEVQDTGVEPEQSMNRIVTVGDLKQRSDHPNVRGSPLNGLEIGDQSRQPNGPPSILRHNILRQLEDNDNGSVSRSHVQVINAKQLDAWYLYSEAGSATWEHIDTAGFLAWVAVMQHKTWYFRAEMTANDKKRMVSDDDPEVDRPWDRSWSRIELCAGDILIMPPGTWHAVYTPDDCVCAGGHFLLASTMDQTLATLGLLDCYPDLTNEDVPENMFDMLGKFIRQVITGTRSLTALQVDSFRLALLDYITVGPEKTFLDSHNEHLRRRAKFVRACQRGNWVQLLGEKANELHSGSLP